MQEVLVVLVALAAITYLGYRAYKSLFAKKSNCDISCGCEATPKSKLVIKK